MYVHAHTSIGTRRPGRLLPDVAAEAKAFNLSRRYLLEDKRGKTHIDPATPRMYLGSRAVSAGVGILGRYRRIGGSNNLGKYRDFRVAIK